jgi:hypothetical protein
MNKFCFNMRLHSFTVNYKFTYKALYYHLWIMQSSILELSLFKES